MKMLIRIILTWSFGMALVLAIVDGAKSFAASELEMTSLGALWRGLHVPSYAAAHGWLGAQLTKFDALELNDAVFALPAWFVFLVIGLILLLFARRPRGTVFITTR